MSNKEKMYMITNYIIYRIREDKLRRSACGYKKTVTSSEFKTSHAAWRKALDEYSSALVSLKRFVE
jgi:hypothetical protein